MTKKDLKELANDIENRLDDELCFELNYEISRYFENRTAIVDVDIDIDNCDDYPEGWDCDVENVISSVVNDWGGWYSWEGWCISVSIPQ